jgi:hypothetical protein
MEYLLYIPLAFVAVIYVISALFKVLGFIVKETADMIESNPVHSDTTNTFTDMSYVEEQTRNRQRYYSGD